MHSLKLLGIVGHNCELVMGGVPMQVKMNCDNTLVSRCIFASILATLQTCICEDSTISTVYYFIMMLQSKSPLIKFIVALHEFGNLTTRGIGIVHSCIEILQ